MPATVVNGIIAPIASLEFATPVIGTVWYCYQVPTVGVEGGEKYWYLAEKVNPDWQAYWGTLSEDGIYTQEDTAIIPQADLIGALESLGYDNKLMISNGTSAEDILDAMGLI